MVPMHGKEIVAALHEPTHPRPLPGGERAFVQFPSWEGLGVGYDPNASMHARSERALPMNQPLPVNCPVEPEDRDRSPVAARGPRQQPGKITEALVLARPLRAGTARGPNRVGSWSQCMHSAKGSLEFYSGVFGLWSPGKKSTLAL